MKTFPDYLLCVALVFGLLAMPGNAVQAKNIAIVSMMGSGEVAFINISKGKVIKRVKLKGAAFPIGLAVTPDQRTAVVASNAGYVSFLAFERVGKKFQAGVLKTLTLLSGPELESSTPKPNEFYRVAITPDGTIAVVTEGNGGGQLFVVDLVTRELAGEPFSIGEDLTTIIINSDTAYVLDEEGPFMHILTEVSLDTFPLPDVDAGDDFALTPDGTQAIVLGGNAFYLMDTSTWSTLDEVSVEEVNGRGVAVSPDGSMAIVTSGLDPSITFLSIQGSSLEVLGVLDVGGTARGVAFTPDGRTAVVTLPEANMVKIINVRTRQVKKTVVNKLGLFPADVVIANVDW